MSLVDRVAVTVQSEGLNRTQGLQLRARALDANGLDVADVSLSPGLFVVILPVQEITVRKTVPVAVETAGRPAPGFAITDTHAIPATVEIEGTAEEVGSVATIQTEPVVLRGQLDERTYEGRLIVPAGIELTDPEQEFEITVEVGPIESVVALADVIEFDAPSAFVATVSPAVATVVLQGSSRRVLGIAPSDVATWIELDGPAVEGVHILTPQIRAPAGIEVISVEPIVVSLNLVLRPQPTAPEPEPPTESEAEEP